MIDALWNGIGFGLLLALLVGPVFFALLQTSMEKGFMHGVFLAIGIALSDAFYFFICYVGISRVLNNETVKAYMGLVGGIIMIAFGAVYFFRPIATKGARQREITGKRTLLKEVLKGFMLNGINPSVLIYWIGIVSVVSVRMEFDNSQVLLFAVGIVATVFLTDILKSYLSTKLAGLATPRYMRIMNRVVGLGLAIFGLVLFYEAFDSGIWSIK